MSLTLRCSSRRTRLSTSLAPSWSSMLNEKVALVSGAGSSGPGWGNGKATRAVLFARRWTSRQAWRRAYWRLAVIGLRSYRHPNI
jgi:hypothetical protein